MQSIDDYLNLLTSEHRKEKNLLWLRQIMKPLVDAHRCAMGMINAFNIDEAIGHQLDVVGEIVGVKRLLNFEPADGKSSNLDDATYRMLIRAQILKNRFDGTIESLEAMWRSFMPDIPLYIRDNQDMTIDVVLFSQNDDFIFDLLTHGYIFPPIMGVTVNYIFTGDKLFGYGQNAIVDGYDVGVWANRTQQGE